MASTSKKCHTCEVNGFKQFKMWMTPEKKDQIRAYCKAKKITMSVFMLQLVNERMATDPVPDEADPNLN